MNTEVIDKAMGFPPPSLLIQRYCKKNEVSEQEAKRAFEETKKFLVLCAKSADKKLAPSAAVDEMWHEFILFTKEYTRYCEMVNGRFIHHQPTDPEEKSEKRQPCAYHITLHALMDTFGEVDEQYWPGAASAKCGSYCSHECSGCSGGKCNSCNG